MGWLRRWRNVALLMMGLGGLSTLSFNCSPSLFLAAKYASSFGIMAWEDRFNDPVSPVVMMTSKQVFHSMLNVTGQYNRATATQKSEFDLRASSLADTSNPAGINAPMQMATTSLAGEVCRGLLDTEKSGQRRFFVDLDFTLGPLTQRASYQASIRRMGQAFWGRFLNRSEEIYLSTFFDDFTSEGGDSSADTDKLLLASCTVMLASFDAVTY